MSYNSKEFKKLQAEWYKKLEDSGFEDIEPHENTLKSWSLEIGRKLNQERPLVMQAKLDYYGMARSFLHDYHFNTETDKEIWERHSEGTGVFAIAKLTNVGRGTVWRTICRLRDAMKTMYIGKTSEEDEDTDEQ